MTPSVSTIGLMFWIYITHDIDETPRKFNKMVFPSGILACKYYPGTLNVTTYISSYESIINVVNSALSKNFGDAILYP